MVLTAVPGPSAHAADAPAPAVAPAAPAISTDPATVAKMDAMIQSYVAADQFMGAILVVKDGQVVLDKGYGFADIAAKTPITPDTRFHIGSMTKQFTAASILLLEERGKLRVDAPVGQYLTGLPQTWAGIPLKNLLTHTSGIPDYENAETRAELALPMTPREMLASVTSKPLDFPTDTSYGYSNTNYVLLAMVVEQVSGKPFASFLQTNIFKPLHMDATRYDAELDGVKSYVSRPGGFGMEAPIAYDHSTDYGDSGISSTTHDLLKWQQALFGGKVLKPAFLAKMTTAYKNDHGVNGNRGFGLIIRAPRGGHRVIHHSGGIPGFTSNMAWYPDLNMSVIVLENVEVHQPAPDPEVLRTQMVDVLSGAAVPPPVVHKAIPVSAEVLENYPGTYERSSTDSIVVTLEGGRLLAQSSGEVTKLSLSPEADRRFFAREVEAQIEFVRNARGEVTSMVLIQPGSADRLFVKK